LALRLFFIACCGVIAVSLAIAFALAKQHELI